MTTIQVPGPSIVQIAVSGTFIDLGYSDNDSLPSIQFTEHTHDVKTVLSGDEPEEIVLRGTGARISVALVRWNEANLLTLLADQRGTATVSPVGRRVVGGSAFFGVRIKSVGLTQAYEFSHCHLVGDSVGDSQWGNRERVLALNFRAFPNPTNNTLYSYTA
jgi:hypothetical protein